MFAKAPERRASSGQLGVPLLCPDCPPPAEDCRDHGEAIEVLALPLAQLDAFLFDESLGKSAGLLFALTWLQARLAGGGSLRD